MQKGLGKADSGGDASSGLPNGESREHTAACCPSLFSHSTCLSRWGSCVLRWRWGLQLRRKGLRLLRRGLRLRLRSLSSLRRRSTRSLSSRWSRSSLRRSLSLRCCCWRCSGPNPRGASRRSGVRWRSRFGSRPDPCWRFFLSVLLFSFGSGGCYYVIYRRYGVMYAPKAHIILGSLI